MLGKKKSYSLSLDEDIIIILDEYAKQISRSRSDVVNICLTQYINDGIKYPPIPVDKTPFAWKQACQHAEE